MDSKTGKIIVVASAVVAAGAGLWYVWKHFIDVDDEEENKEATSVEAEKTEEPIADLPVPKDVMIKAFSEISESIEIVMAQLSKYEEQLTSSGSYTPEMVNQEIQQKFVYMLTNIEEKVYEMNKISKEDATKAYQLLINDRDFKRATYNIRSILAMLNGETPEAPDLPESMTLAYTIEIMQAITANSSAIMEKSIAEICEKKGVTRDELIANLTSDEDMQREVFESYMKDMETKRTEVLKHFKVDKAMLQVAMMVYQNDPTFQEAMIKVSKEQQEQFQLLGLSM